jgi:hypothetical protein
MFATPFSEQASGGAGVGPQQALPAGQRREARPKPHATGTGSKAPPRHGRSLQAVHSRAIPWLTRSPQSQPLLM